MTPDEIARFALMLEEADKVRARIARDEATENPDDAPDVYLEAAA